MRRYCKRCKKETEWYYFGYATGHGATYHCENCGASSYDGMMEGKDPMDEVIDEIRGELGLCKGV